MIIMRSHLFSPDQHVPSSKYCTICGQQEKDEIHQQVITPRPGKTKLKSRQIVPPVHNRPKEESEDWAVLVISTNGQTNYIRNLTENRAKEIEWHLFSRPYEEGYLRKINIDRIIVFNPEEK